MTHFYKKTEEEVLSNFGTNPKQGLSTLRAETLLEKFGPNEFTKKKKEGLFSKIVDAIKEPMMIALIIAAFISLAIGEVHDFIGIIAAMSLGIGIGLVTENSSKKAADALAKMSADIVVKVLRDGQIKTINKSLLVPGDIVYLEAGDMVPADGRLLDTLDLKVREDMLTGESDDVSKHNSVLLEVNQEQDLIPALQKNMVFGGTLIACGRGTMIVTSTGDNTEMGHIAKNLDSDIETPLQIKLGKLGTLIAKVSSLIAVLLFLFMSTKIILSDFNSGLSQDMLLQLKTAFTFCIALIVAAVPEGLPTMINMTLAIAMKSMSKINALVTKKEACETIGSVSVICSDKTGTLTQNRMTVKEVQVNNHTEFDLNCIVNSTADLELDEDGQVKYIGSATECALLLHQSDLGVSYKATRDMHPILEQEQFSSATKQMSTTINIDNNKVKLIKGAPEVLIESCKLKLEDKKTILAQIETLQKQSMRVLGFASQNVSLENQPIYWTGFVGIKDPLRDGVKESVANLKQAGVSTKMLTGDNIVTAIAIGNELNLLSNNMRAVESGYIDKLTDEELQEEIKTIGIVARSKPDTKMRIVQALQAIGEVVAVTGDGINDAPALSKADVGIAMGIAGTEVSKNAADIILTDDSFSTIEKAVKWGRGIYDNFQRFIQFQLTVNIVAFSIAIISQLLGQEPPFSTVQLLWVNIIMDGFPALALGIEPVRDKVLSRKPVSRHANIITKSMITSMLLNASYIVTIVVLQGQFNFLNVSSEQATTVTFSLFAFFALFNALNSREFGLDSIFPNFTKNKVVLYVLLVTGIVQIIITNVFNSFFGSVALDMITWLKVVGLASTIVIANEIVKEALRNMKNKLNK